MVLPRDPCRDDWIRPYVYYILKFIRGFKLSIIKAFNKIHVRPVLSPKFHSVIALDIRHINLNEILESFHLSSTLPIEKGESFYNSMWVTDSNYEPLTQVVNNEWRINFHCVKSHFIGVCLEIMSESQKIICVPFNQISINCSLMYCWFWDKQEWEVCW